MGPQFNIFNKLKKIDMDEIIFDDYGMPVDKNIETFKSNINTPIYISGIEEFVYYKCSGKRMYFGSGTTKEYVEFLNHLSIISGFSNIEDIIQSEGLCFFKELICFGVQAGTIGPIIARKLYHDFRDNFNNANLYFAKTEGGNKFWVHYQNWCAGLYVAKEDGAIMIV